MVPYDELVSVCGVPGAVLPTILHVPCLGKTLSGRLEGWMYLTNWVEIPEVIEPFNYLTGSRDRFT
jgi:hypothetical protein